MTPYFPLTGDRFEMSMNAHAGTFPLIEVDTEKYEAERRLKDEILASDYAYYFHCPPEVNALAWDAIETILPDMAAHYPEYFQLDRQGDQWQWTNRLLSTVNEFSFGEDATLPLPPLDWLGRQVQEDLVLMAETPTGETVCVGGHLCFGSAWCLGDKIGQSFLAIHGPVPEFRERIGNPSDLLMRRLKHGRPVCRLNWSVTCNHQLNLAPALSDDWHRERYGMTLENAEDRLFWRVERQTLSRLPRTRGILFTIHTHAHPLRDVISDPERLRVLTGVMQNYPENMREYKGMTPYFPVLLAYLEQALHRSRKCQGI